MQLSHGICGSPFTRSPIVCAKTVSSLLKERMQTIVYVTKDFFQMTQALTIVYAKFLQENFT